MANFKKNICNFLKNIYYFIKKYLYSVFFEKLYIKSIFVFEEIPHFALANQRTFDHLNEEEKIEVIKGLEHISALNQDFNNLRTKYILYSKHAANYSNFKEFIKKEESGFYLKKAKLNLVFKSLLVFFQLLILYYDYPKNFCSNELIDDNAKIFWIYDNKKYKVEVKVIDRLFYLTIFILGLKKRKKNISIRG